MKRGRKLVVVAWVVAIATLPDAAMAGDESATGGAGSAGAQDRDPAEIAYTLGVVHFRERRYADAIREFNKAYRLDPNPVLVFNMARAFEEMKDYEPAVRFYRKYLEMSPDAPDGATVRDTLETLELLARRSKSPESVEIAVTSVPEGGQLLVDGRPVGPTPLKTRVSTGTHFFTVEKEGYERGSQELSLEAGQAKAVHFDLVAAQAPEPAVRESVNGRRWAWITLGGATALLAGSALSGLQALKKSDRLDELDQQPTGGSVQEYEDLKSKGRMYALTADGLLIAGLAGLAVAAVLYTSDGPERPSGHVQPVVTAGNGLGLVLPF